MFDVSGKEIYLALFPFLTEVWIGSPQHFRQYMERQLWYQHKEGHNHTCTKPKATKYKGRQRISYGTCFTEIQIGQWSSINM